MPDDLILKKKNYFKILLYYQGWLDCQKEDNSK